MKPNTKIYHMHTPPLTTFMIKCSSKDFFPLIFLYVTNRSKNMEANYGYLLFVPV